MILLLLSLTTNNSIGTICQSCNLDADRGLPGGLVRNKRLEERRNLYNYYFETNECNVSQVLLNKTNYASKNIFRSKCFDILSSIYSVNFKKFSLETEKISEEILLNKGAKDTHQCINKTLNFQEGIFLLKTPFLILII